MFVVNGRTHGVRTMGVGDSVRGGWPGIAAGVHGPVHEAAPLTDACYIWYIREVPPDDQMSQASRCRHKRA